MITEVQQDAAARYRVRRERRSFVDEKKKKRWKDKKFWRKQALSDENITFSLHTPALPPRARRKFLVLQKSSKFLLERVECEGEAPQVSHFSFAAAQEDEKNFFIQEKSFSFAFFRISVLSCFATEGPRRREKYSKVFPGLQGELCIYDVSYGSCKCFHA